MTGTKRSLGLIHLVDALVYPLRSKRSLLFGGAIVALFGIALSAVELGDSLRACAAVAGSVLAIGLAFGIVSDDRDRFTIGDPGPPPPAEMFFPAGTFLQSFVLGTGAYLAAFGPFLLSLLVCTYLVLGSIAAHDQSIVNDLEKIPGTNYYTARQTAAQTQEVKRVLAAIGEERTQRIGAADVMARGANTPAGAQNVSSEADRVDESPLSPLEKSEGPTMGRIVTGIFGLAPPLVVTGVTAFVWGLFFFPAAIATALRTRSLRATISPPAVLRTIQLIGRNYLSIVAAGAAILVLWVVIAGSVSLGQSYLTTGGLGSLLLEAAQAFLGLYLSVVLACIVGLAVPWSRDPSREAR